MKQGMGPQVFQNQTVARLLQKQGGGIFGKAKKSAGDWQTLRRLDFLDRGSDSLALDESFFQHFLVAKPQIGDIG